MKIAAMNKTTITAGALPVPSFRRKPESRCGVRCVACYIILLLFIIARQAPAAENMQLRPGEKLQYKVYWAMIEAADVTLEILPMEKSGGAQAFHFAMTASTSELVENIYPVRDRIDSWADAAMTNALRYKEKKQARKTKDIEITFDWPNQTVISSKKSKKKPPVKLLPGAFDPLSVFYFFRMQELRENLEISRPVSDGKSCVIGKARVRSRQKVQVAGREYDTFLVEPELGKLGGVFEKNPSAKLQIWVTADKQRLPVMIKSEVAVGSFTAELVGIEYRKM
jgi:hypothetical protein